MTSKNRINANKRIRWIEDDLIHVNPSVYRRRLDSLIRGMHRLKIRQGDVHDDQMMKELESKQDKAIQSLVDVGMVLNQICVQDIDFRYKQKMQRKNELRQERQNACLIQMEEEVKIVSPDVTDILNHLRGSYQEDSVPENTLFEKSDISNFNLNVTIDDIDISIFDMLNQE